MKERGELMPLEKHKVVKPESWKRNIRSFDDTWNDTFNVQGQGKHAVPECVLSKYKLDCESVDHDVVMHARNRFKAFAQRGVNDKIYWLTGFVRPEIKNSSDGKIWNNFSTKHVRGGRETWRCTFCKCNPNEPSAAARADPQHKFKLEKRRSDSKFSSCPDFSAGTLFRKRVVAEAKALTTRHTYHVPVAKGAELNVHKSVWRAVFNVGERVLKRCTDKNLIDLRAGRSGRKRYDMLRIKIEQF
jgi:hypothetical protein